MISIFIVRGISYIQLKILRWGKIKVVNQLFDWLMLSDSFNPSNGYCTMIPTQLDTGH